MNPKHTCGNERSAFANEREYPLQLGIRRFCLASATKIAVASDKVTAHRFSNG